MYLRLISDVDHINITRIVFLLNDKNHYNALVRANFQVNFFSSIHNAYTAGALVRKVGRV